MSHSVTCYIRATTTIDNPTLTIVKMQTDDVGSQYTLYKCEENQRQYMEIIQSNQTLAAPATDEMIERCFVEPNGQSDRGIHPDTTENSSRE